MKPAAESKRNKVFYNSHFEQELENARSSGNYDPLYSFTTEWEVQKTLMKLFSPIHDKLSIVTNLFYDLLKIFGYKKGKTELERIRHKKAYYRLFWSITCYVWTYGVDAWVELFKWKITSHFASVFNPENLPKKPRDCIIYNNPRKLFFGRAQRFYMRMDHHTKRSFANNVLMLKKGAPPVSSEMVFTKKMETYLQLTTAPKIFDLPNTLVPREILEERSTLSFDREISRTIEYSQDRLKLFIDKVINEVFKEKRFVEDDLVTPSFPSFSANYNWKRGSGGGVLAITNFVQKHRRELAHLEAPYGPPMDQGMIDFLEIGVEKFLEVKQVECVFQDGDGCESEGFCFTFDDHKTRSAYSYIFKLLFEAAETEEPRTATVGLPEPLKVRVITKGPPLTYFVLRRVQKFLWTVLKDHPTFQLIGAPLTEEIVNKIFSLRSLNDRGEWVLSGDYKASTDNIYSWVTEYVNKKLFETLNHNDDNREKPLLDRVESLTKKALTGHWILNPEYQVILGLKIYCGNGKKNKWTFSYEDLVKYRRKLEEGLEVKWYHQIFSDCGETPESMAIKIDQFEIEHKVHEIPTGADQKQGQLMGSVVSFPYLCIINAAVCWMSMSNDMPNQELCKLRDLPLLINGDDCVFTGTAKLMEKWEKSIKYVGFSSSMGKTYFVKRDILVMNSMTFVWSARESRWVYWKYINFGLVRGVNKAGETQQNPFAYASIQKDLIEKTPHHFQQAVMKLFFRNHMKTFQSTGLPFYMPQWSGGLGLIPEPSHFTLLDRLRLCTRMSNYESFQPPPFYEKWLLDKSLKGFLTDFSAIAGTTKQFLRFKKNGPISQDELEHQTLHDLDEKTYYTELLTRTLLSKRIESYENHKTPDGDTFIQEILIPYIQRLAAKWKETFKPGIRAKTLEQLNKKLDKVFMAIVNVDRELESLRTVGQYS
jgi:hypothetical protein